MNKTETNTGKDIEEQAACVVLLRAELSTAERNLAETVAIAMADGFDPNTLPSRAINVIKWPQVTVATRTFAAVDQALADGAAKRIATHQRAAADERAAAGDSVVLVDLNTQGANHE